MSAKLFTCGQKEGPVDTLILVGPHNSGKNTFADLVGGHSGRVVQERSTVDCVKETMGRFYSTEQLTEQSYRLLLSKVYDALMEFDEVPLKDVCANMATKSAALFITYIRNPVHVRRFQELAVEQGRTVLTVLVTRDVGPIQNNNADELVFSDMGIFDAIVVNDGTLHELGTVAQKIVDIYL